MDRAKLESRKIEIEQEIETIRADVQKAIDDVTERGRAAILNRMGRVAMIDEMLGIDQPDPDVPPAGETAPED